ncbi:MAG TPA: hypothetical protein VGM24_12440 [Puia sp.]|jgi:hypothetical protein
MKLKILLSLLSAALLTVSCNRYYYKPNAINTPLFTGGGQAHLNLAGSVGNPDNGKNSEGNTYFFDIQGSVSPVNHLAFIANYSTYSYRVNNPDILSGHVDASAHLLEGGIGGYYASHGRKVQFVSDLFVGYGGGPVRSDVDMNASRFFIQPGIGMHSPWVDAAFNLRFSVLKFSDFNSKGRDDDYLLDAKLIDGYGRRIDQRTYSFAEPGITLRAGYKFAKVQLQMVLANEISNVAWRYNAARFTAGFYFSLEDALKMK